MSTSTAAASCWKIPTSLTVPPSSGPAWASRWCRKGASYFPILSERRRQLAGSLSGGEQQMLAIGRAIMAEPRLLLVDELSLGLMPKMIDICLDALMQLKREGLTIVLVEQNTARALEVADQVCVLSSGAQVFKGTSAEAKSAGSLFATFLGTTE